MDIEAIDVKYEEITEDGATVSNLEGKYVHEYFFMCILLLGLAYFCSHIIH